MDFLKDSVKHLYTCSLHKDGQQQAVGALAEELLPLLPQALRETLLALWHHCLHALRHCSQQLTH